MINFSQKKWGDVCTLEYGKGIRDYKNEDNNYSVYGSAGRVGSHSEFHLDKGVIVARKGTLDVHYSDEPFFVIDTAFYLKPKPELNAKWAYYALKNFDIKKLTSGSGVPSLSRDEFYAEDLYLPPLEYQHKVADILSNIDSKIELNQKMNETLEDTVKTLFKSWFIDFDPVRAKAEGKPTGLSKEISELFPNSFEDSKLGEVPKGWTVEKIGTYFDVLLGGTPSRKKEEYWNGDIPWINSGEINNFRVISHTELITKSGLENSSTKLMPKRSTLIAITGATLGQVSLNEIDVCANQSVIGISPSPSIFPEYVYLWINFTIKTLISSQTGGAQQHINTGNVKDHLIVLPDENICNYLKTLFESVFDMISANLFENQTLISLRDTLLPKLISGELKVPEAENLVEEAGV